jgi:tRNA(Arg) A34 adenosine deaminase TadA
MAEPPLSRRDFVRALGVVGVVGIVRGERVLANAAGGSSHDPTPFPELDHHRFMRRAIVQAKKVPQAPFGAVIIRGTTGEEIATGHNRSRVNPIFHGEIEAINHCAAEHPGVNWSQLVLYTTAEPCPMCQAAIEWTGIAMTVYGSSVPFLQKLGWHQIDIRAQEGIRRTPFRRTVLLSGILEQECNALFLAVPSISRGLSKLRESA